MHIGSISALLSPGAFAFDDVVIEGKTPDAAPFFRAKRITMYVPWWTLFKKRLEVEVELTGWKMTVESFAGGGGTNIPKLTPAARSEQAANGPAVYDHRAIRVCEEWRVRVPRSRHTLARTRTQPQLPTRPGRESQCLRRQGAVLGWARPDSEIPADAHRLHDALRAGWRPRHPAPHRPRHRRRGDARQRQSRLQPLA